ncbi:MAG: class I SAM-dependent RNA methyltransferase, partial [Caldilineaceae bacterium]
EPAPTRIAPRCRHFGLCGGCDWQHIAYDAQLAFKTGIVREQLTRFAHLPDVEVRPCLPSPGDYGYRNTTRLAATEQGRAGYRVAGTNSVFVVEECPILEPALQVELKEVLALELEPGDEVALRVPADPLRVGAFDYHVSIESFFQVNTAMAARLVDEVMAVLAPKPGDVVLDLYAGAGLFTLPLAAAVGKAGRVLAVEAAQAAVADGQRNTAAWPQVGWFQGTVETAVAQASVTDTRWDHVLLDPPRRGVAKDALLAIAALRAPSLVYVSCDPATLARDTVILGGQGYRLLMAQPLDLFPQTAHVETVAQFVRADDDQPA